MTVSRMDKINGHPLMEAAERVDWLIESVPDYVALIDAQGTVLAANNLLAQRMQLGVDQLVGSNLYSHFPPESSQRRKVVAAEVLASGEPLEYEDFTASGAILKTLVKPVTCGESGEVLLAIILTDITERKNWETKVNRLATAVQQTAEAIIIMDPEFIIQYVNQSFEQMTGYAQNDVKDGSIALLYKGPEQIAVLETIIDEVRRGEIWAGRTSNTDKYGQIIQCEKTVSPIRGHRGVIIGYVSVWRDVTRIAQLEQQLMNAQKMEVIGTLAAGIAHDFNNILGPIILHAELGLDMFPPSGPPHPARECFQRILGAGERAAVLAEQILNLSKRRSKDQPVAFPLSSVVRECLKLLRPSTPAGIEIRYKNEAESDQLLADPALVHQVIMNLCTNAVQAMENHGGILTIYIQSISQPLFQDIEDSHGFVELTVADTGHGISPEDLDKIFDPFFTTRSPDKGTGLGLAVTRSIVDRMGGSITVDTRPGQGTTFRVLFPLAHEISGSEDIRFQDEPYLRGEEHILFVDDDPSLMATGESALKRLGYSVVACRNAQEALLALGRKRFDLVMSNVNMPGMNGLELARRLLLRRPQLPVVLISGQTRLTEEECQAMGVREFLSKPFHMRELAKCLRRILDQEIPEKLQTARNP